MAMICMAQFSASWTMVSRSSHAAVAGGVGPRPRPQLHGGASARPARRRHELKRAPRQRVRHRHCGGVLWLHVAASARAGRSAAASWLGSRVEVLLVAQEVVEVPGEEVGERRGEAFVEVVLQKRRRVVNDLGRRRMRGGGRGGGTVESEIEKRER